MSTSHEDLQRDLEDRAIDKLLEESAGRAKAPDVSEKVAAALRAEREPAVPAPKQPVKQRGFRWRRYAVAAGLLASAGLGTAIFWQPGAHQPGPRETGIVMDTSRSTGNRTLGDRDDLVALDSRKNYNGAVNHILPEEAGKELTETDRKLAEATKDIQLGQNNYREELGPLRNQASAGSTVEVRGVRVRHEQQRVKEYIDRVQTAITKQQTLRGTTIAADGKPDPGRVVDQLDRWQTDGDKTREQASALKSEVSGKMVKDQVVLTLEAARKYADNKKVAQELLELGKEAVINAPGLADAEREKLVKQLDAGLADPAKIPPQPTGPVATPGEQKYQEALTALHDRKVELLAARNEKLRIVDEVAQRGQPAQLAKAKEELREVEVEIRDLPANLPALGDQGEGPGNRGNNYERIVENEFLAVNQDPLSTFSIDVDTASYSICRSYLKGNPEENVASQLPPEDAVRIEELVNYFHYDYAPPQDDKTPFAAHTEIATCPWNGDHRLLRIGLKGREIDSKDLPPNNLVFLIDVSGSMNQSNKLPLVTESLSILAESLSGRSRDADTEAKKDRIAIVVYAGASGLALESTTCDKAHSEIIPALKNLQAGGSTNGAAGIEQAYRVAQRHFIKGGNNRVILCTDGDFNVGVTGEGALERLAEEKAKTGVFLSVYGFGMGNLQDNVLEKISGRGNGTYGYIDSMAEARKVFVEELAGTLTTIAKDVKIQVEFNPAQVAAYRLIGYENRMLAAQDFNDDKKDAGEIGVGHTVTALYEIVPAGKQIELPKVDDLKYQRPQSLTEAAKNGEMMTLKLRYKEPDGNTSKLLEFPVTDKGQRFGEASGDFRFASAVAAYGMLLRRSEYSGNATMSAVIEIAEASKGTADKHRDEFLELARAARKILGR